MKRLMKQPALLRACSVAAAVLAFCLMGGCVALAEQSAADKAFKTVVDAQQATRDEESLKGLTPLESDYAVDRRAQALAEAGRIFLNGYPNDARRWQVIAWMLDAYPAFFVHEDKSATSEEMAARTAASEAQWAAWQKDVRAWRAEFIADPRRLPADLLETRSRFAFHAQLEDFATAVRTDALPPLRARLDDYLKISTQPGLASHAIQSYLMQVSRLGVAAALPELRSFAEYPDEEIRKLVAVQLKTATEPLTIKFTALDGRTVDLAQMRDKVVLVDFWATWCGPCVKELPNVLSIYKDYHGRGFEVVGVALEDAKVEPQDNADEGARKIAEARNKLVEFIARKQLPWPQYFDGLSFQNEISKTYSITALPTMFLLDRGGAVVSMNARGEKLREEVQRLIEAAEFSRRP